MKIGIIVAKFNNEITEKMLFEAEKVLNEKGANYEIERVPGAFEIPLIAQRMAKLKEYDALITLGCVIKGETDHYDMVCRACVDGISKVMLKHDLPIAFEVLMVDSIKKAEARIGRGRDAAEVAIFMAETQI
jgi:6,7-dimethyl-8-ribityllumazine synthase